MNLLVLDDQLAASEAMVPIQKWFRVDRLGKLLPGQLILDDRIPQILVNLNFPTFITIDQGFWERTFCNPQYCILYFALRDDQQKLLPGLLRRLMRRIEFQTRARRMGKIVRVSSSRIDFWKFGSSKLEQILWTVKY